MTPRIHFDGEPNRFAQMRKLFNQRSTLLVRWARPVAAKFRLRSVSVEQWFRRHAGRRAS